MVLGEAGEFAIAGLTKAVNGLKDAIQFGDKAQQASLALGETYKTATAKLGGTMDGLRGSFKEQFTAGFVGMQAGMQGNTAGLARLVNQQRLTGTAHEQSAKTMAHLEATLGLSRDATNAFAESFVQTGAEWQVSTATLVQAVESLKASFPAMRLSEMGDKVTTAVAGLTGELGGEKLAAPLHKVMSMVMDTSLEGMKKLQLLGIGDLREQLSASKSGAQAQEILKSAIITASEKFKTIAGGADKAFFRLGIASEVFGAQAINFTTLQENFGKRMKDSGKDAFDFGLTLKTLKDEIMAPLQAAFMKWHDPIVRAFKGISGAAKIFTEGLAKMVDDSFPSIEKAILSFALNTIKTSRDFVHWGQENLDTLKRIWGTGGKSGEGIIGVVVDGFKNIIKWSVLLADGLKAWFMRKHEWQNDAVTYVGGLSADEQAMLNAHTAKIAAEAAAKNAPTKLFDPMIEELERLIANTSESSSKTNDILESIDEKTVDPRELTTPAFLDHTADVLGASMERILGIGSGATITDLLEATQEGNEMRAKMAANTPGGTSSFTPLYNS